MEISGLGHVELTQQQTVRLVARDRIKCCTIHGRVPIVHPSHDPELAKAIVENDIIEQIAREIAVAMKQYGKVWIQPNGECDGARHFFASVEIIVPEASIGEAGERHVPPVELRRALRREFA